MNSVLKIAAIVTALVVASAFVLLSANWNLDPAYSIRFKGTKAEGTFFGPNRLGSFRPRQPASRQNGSPGGCRHH